MRKFKWRIWRNMNMNIYTEDRRSGRNSSRPTPSRSSVEERQRESKKKRRTGFWSQDMSKHESQTPYFLTKPLSNIGGLSRGTLIRTWNYCKMIDMYGILKPYRVIARPPRRAELRQIRCATKPLEAHTIRTHGVWNVTLLYLRSVHAHRRPYHSKREPFSMASVNQVSPLSSNMCWSRMAFMFAARRQFMTQKCKSTHAECSFKPNWSQQVVFYSQTKK